MVRVVVDASVVVKWFHDPGEAEIAEARAMLRAHQAGVIAATILDLTIYELGNVLLRSLRRPAQEVAGRLNDLLRLCGPPISFQPGWRVDAAELGQKHDLTYYDAAYAAAARGLEAPLVTADRQLLASGLAESPTAFAQRLQLLSL